MRCIALVLCLVILAALPASAEAELCFSRENAPYWHKNADCHFAETDLDGCWHPRWGNARA